MLVQKFFIFWFCGNFVFAEALSVEGDKYGDIVPQGEDPLDSISYLLLKEHLKRPPSRISQDGEPILHGYFIVDTHRKADGSPVEPLPAASFIDNVNVPGLNPPLESDQNQNGDYNTHQETQGQEVSITTEIPNLSGQDVVAPAINNTSKESQFPTSTENSGKYDIHIPNQFSAQNSIQTFEKSQQERVKNNSPLGDSLLTLGHFLEQHKPFQQVAASSEHREVAPLSPSIQEQIQDLQNKIKYLQNQRTPAVPTIKVHGGQNQIQNPGISPSQHVKLEQGIPSDLKEEMDQLEQTLRQEPFNSRFPQNQVQSQSLNKVISGGVTSAKNHQIPFHHSVSHKITHPSLNRVIQKSRQDLRQTQQQNVDPEVIYKNEFFKVVKGLSNYDNVQNGDGQNKNVELSIPQNSKQEITAPRQKPNQHGFLQPRLVPQALRHPSHIQPPVFTSSSEHSMEKAINVLSHFSDNYISKLTKKEQHQRNNIFANAQKLRQSALIATTRSPIYANPSSTVRSFSPNQFQSKPTKQETNGKYQVLPQLEQNSDLEIPSIVRNEAKHPSSSKTSQVRPHANYFPHESSLVQTGTQQYSQETFQNTPQELFQTRPVNKYPPHLLFEAQNSRDIIKSYSQFEVHPPKESFQPRPQFNPHSSSQEIIPQIGQQQGNLRDQPERHSSLDIIQSYPQVERHPPRDSLQLLPQANSLQGNLQQAEIPQDFVHSKHQFENHLPQSQTDKYYPSNIQETIQQPHFQPLAFSQQTPSQSPLSYNRVVFNKPNQETSSFSEVRSRIPQNNHNQSQYSIVDPQLQRRPIDPYGPRNRPSFSSEPDQLFKNTQQMENVLKSAYFPYNKAQLQVQGSAQYETVIVPYRKSRQTPSQSPVIYFD